MRQLLLLPEPCRTQFIIFKCSIPYFRQLTLDRRRTVQGKLASVFARRAEDLVARVNLRAGTHTYRYTYRVDGEPRLT